MPRKIENLRRAGRLGGRATAQKTRGKTYLEIYGPEKAAVLIAQRRLSGSMTKSSHGKTYEEIYGNEKAAFLKEQRRITASRPSITKGKTYEEIYGVERARELRSSRGIHGKANNLWRHGNYEPLDRGEDWPEIRRNILARDNFTCQDCARNRCLLDVHHVIPYRLFPKNLPQLLITLCRKCHAKWDSYWRGVENYTFASS